MNRTENLTAFQLALRQRVIAKINELRDDGTVSMTTGNLMMLCLPDTRMQNLKGAPQGTNARYFFALAFDEVVNSLAPSFRSFFIQ